MFLFIIGDKLPLVPIAAQQMPRCVLVNAHVGECLGKREMRLNLLRLRQRLQVARA
jgi:hypothetical protein